MPRASWSTGHSPFSDPFNLPMKQTSNTSSNGPPPPLTSAIPAPDPQRYHSRRNNRRTSAVNYYQSASAKQPPELSAYMPPPQSASCKPTPYCTPRGNKQQNQNPSFDRDFGPFGIVPQQNKNDVGDISSMFRRSDYQPIPCMQQQQQAQLQQQQQHQYQQTSNEPIQTEMNPNRGGNVLLRSQLPPPNQPTVVSGGTSLTNSQRNLRRNEDVDRILNKYGRTSRSNVRDMEGTDPDFASLVGTDAFLTTSEKYCKQSIANNHQGQGFQGYWDHQRGLTQDFIVPQRRRNVQGQGNSSGKSLDNMVPAAAPPGRCAGETNVSQNNNYQHAPFQPPVQMSEERERQQNHFTSPPPPPPAAAAPPPPQSKPALEFKQSSHVFPFKESMEGHLLIDATQIAFESRKLCVLMSDPNNNTTIEFSSNKVSNEAQAQTEIGPAKHERILHEVKRALSIMETSPGSRLAKEINSCYSDSNKATEDFEQRILQRLACGKNADTHVLIGDKVFPCHSLALEVYSSFFEGLSRPSESIQRVYIPENRVSAEAFPVVMDWILQSEEGRRGIPKKENIVSVYIAAKHLGVKELETQCISFMERRVRSNDPDLLTIWDAVKRRQAACPELVRIVAGKIAASYHDIFENKRYLQMDVDELYMLLNSDDVSIESEMDVYDSAVSWLLHDWKTRKTHTNKIMSTVRFGLLSPLQLTQISLCPETNKLKGEKDCNEVLAFGSVKSMIDDGLSYSILDDSYKSQPDELKKWVEKTNVKVPAQRTSLARKRMRGGPLIQEKISLLEDASQTKLQPSSHSKPVEKSSSYTLLNAEPSPNTPRIDFRDEFDENPSAPKNTGSLQNYPGNIRNRSRSRIPTLASSSGNRATAPTPASTDKGNKRPATFQYPPGPGSTVVHELSKPKLLTHSSNMLTEDGENDSYEENMRPRSSPSREQHFNKHDQHHHNVS